MKRLLAIIFAVLTSFSMAVAQERVVEIDFESSAFLTSPDIPYDKPFGVIGEAGKDIEFVKLNISYAGKSYVLHSFVWNKIERNSSDIFKIVVPPVLKSNTKYDFEIITYKSLSPAQKEVLIENLEDKIRFLLSNNIYFDGENVVVNKPKNIYAKLDLLIKNSLQYYESKNSIPIPSPSDLVLENLKNQNDFEFKELFEKSDEVQKKEFATQLIDKKLDQLVELVISELKPFINSQIVQHHWLVNIQSVETDKEKFTLPVNFGFYAWNKSVDIDNISVKNIDFTPAVGLTLPFKSRSRLAAKSNMFDSFGFSAGVLLQPVKDANGTEYVTPGINLPIYTALGIRLFKVIRVNGGVLILGEKGTQNFSDLSIIPTAGIALELDLWMGIKK